MQPCNTYKKRKGEENARHTLIFTINFVNFQDEGIIRTETGEGSTN